MTDAEKKHLWYLEHKEEVKERARQWETDNLEKAKQSHRKAGKKYEDKNQRWKDPVRSARSAKWAKEHPERIAEIVRKHNYGISPEEYKLKFEEQSGVCAVCGKPETHVDRRSNKVRELSVDHNQMTKQIRGLLCGNCNRGLGMFFEDGSLLLKAIEYLRKYNKEVNNGNTAFNE